MKRLILLTVLCCGATGALAEESGLSLRQLLLSPGKLTQGHAEFEGDCDKCHVSFDKANQTPLCMDCHEEIAADVKTKRGFHGGVAGARPIDCGRCHTDHKGREQDITGIDPDHFNHDRTDFPLLASHQSLRCEDCHQSDTKFRDADRACSSCHEDVHEGRLGDDCSVCHSETGWQAKAFDHSSTDFPLEGRHADAECSACHVDQTFEGASTECVTCHLSKDRHLGVFGRQCGSCHVSETWETIRFDHGRQTEFPLRGRHGKVACEACHRKGLPLSLPTACTDCHAADDVHRGANGTDCASCHSEDSWQTVEFDHGRDTDFQLVGAHSDVVCASCHATGTTVEKPTEPRVCADCHGPADPHQGELGKDCQQCHGQTAWNLNLVFSHDFTEFPLTGSHQPLPCESCHFSSAFHDTLNTCGSCHQGDDFHDGVFGATCIECHNTAAWISWNFDHDVATEYLLQGAHVRLACGLCHEPDLSDPTHPSQQCADCHTQDDIHRGGFGPDCGQCHGIEAFDQER